MDMSFYQLIYIQGGYQRIYGTRIPVLSNVVEIIAAIPIINGPRAIFLQFCDHQDTRSE